MKLFDLSSEETNDYVVLTCGMPNGVGDFKHLYEILFDFKPYADSLNLKMAVVISFNTDSQKEFVEQQLKELPFRVDSFILNDQEQIKIFVENNSNLQAILKNSLVIFDISYPLPGDILLSYANASGIPIVEIFEYSKSFSYKPYNMVDRPMGLPDEKNQSNYPKYGLKFKPCLETKEEALLSIENKEFQSSLLETDNVTKAVVQDFISNKQFYPAYLQDENSIFSFIELCLSHPDIPHESPIFYLNNYKKMFSEKMVAIYDYSTWISAESFDSKLAISTDPDPSEDENYLMVTSFESKLLQRHRHYSCYKNFDEIKLNINGNIQCIKLREVSNPKTITILTGFILNNSDYNKLLVIAPLLAGCSGDNSLDNTLAHGLLPIFELSKNKKFASLLHLIGKLGAEYAKKQDLFNPNLISNFFDKYLYFADKEVFKTLINTDLKPLLACWPLMVNGLIKDFNFYDKSKHIFYEAIMFTAVKNNNIKLLRNIYEVFPELDFKIPDDKNKQILNYAKDEMRDVIFELIADQERKLNFRNY